MDDQAKKCYGIILYFLSQSFLLWILMLLLNCPRSMSCYALKGTELLKGSLIEACNNYEGKIRVLLIQCWLSPPHYPPVSPVSPSSPFHAALYSLRPVGLSLRDVVGQLAVPRFFASHPLLRRKHQQGSNDY